MTVETKQRFTIAEYYKMGDDGILGDRTELINGEIIEMSPIGRLHAGCVNRLTNFLVLRLSGLAVVAIQNPVLINNNSQPQPDLAILRYRSDFYSAAHPDPADVLLLIEVSDTTLKLDREVKVDLYASSGIIEVWIVNLQDHVVERYSQLSDKAKYQSIQNYRTGENLTILGLTIPVDEIF